MAVGAAGQVASTTNTGREEKMISSFNQQKNTRQEKKTFPRDQFRVLCRVEFNIYLH